jgi:predicted phosphodiesterase
MRLHVLSDLHFEFGSFDVPDTDADVVVLAGDVAVGPRGFDWIQQRFRGRPVVYVLGNHEFYRHNLPRLTKALKREARGSHIHLLENSSVELRGFWFLGCTLWTNFALSPDPAKAMCEAECFLKDFRLIRFGPADRVLQAKDTVDVHRASVAWLESELERHDPARTVVVTHHAPSPRSEAPGHANSPLSAAFASDLGALVEQSRIPLWIHGHTHFNVDYLLGVTRVITNQRGYPQAPCVGFDVGKVIEV